jgi:ATP-binding cassette subfamily C (CFTR/MRP) protein 1
MAAAITDGDAPAPTQEMHPVQALQPAPRKSCLNTLFFTDLNVLVSKAARTKKLETGDLWATPQKVEELYEEFQVLWNKEQEKPKEKVRIRRVFWGMNKGLVFRAVCLQLLAACGAFSGPLLLNRILTVIEARQSTDCDVDGALGPDAFTCKPWAGYVLCAGLFVGLLSALLCQNMGTYLMKLVAIRIRGVLISGVYIKAMKLSSVGMSKMGTGMITNLTSNDAEQLLMSIFVMASVVIAPIQLISSFVLLGIFIGGTFIVGIVVVFVLILTAVTMMIKSMKYKILQSKCADSRIQLTKELVSGVRIVKSYGWEMPFEKEVMRLRKLETRYIQIQMFYRCFMVVVIISAPIMVATSTFSTFVATGGVLTPPIVFTSFAIMNLMRFPMAMLPFAMIETSKVIVAFGRLQSMLLADEQQTGVFTEGAKLEITDSEFGFYHAVEDKSKGKGKGKGGCMGCLGKLMPSKGKGKGKGKVSDAPPPEPVDESKLVDVERANGETMKMKRVLTVDRFAPTPGGLTLVMGLVGSGKSTLLSALLNEVEVIKGERSGLPERVGYAAQTPWIVNTTVEKNIKFGGVDRGEKWYNKVIDKCCLKADIDILPAGDQTEIGERGVNLSGGQKARVAVARTVYRDCDFYMFDDPLAAVDAHVGKRLFDEVLGNKGILQGKTRLLVTHQTQYAPMADQVVVVEDGCIIASGTYTELIEKGVKFDTIATAMEETAMEKQITEASELARQISDKSKDGSPTRRTVIEPSKGGEHKGLEKDGELVKAESAAEGSVNMFTYWRFIKDGFTVKALVCVLFVAMGNVGVRLCSDFWLALWSEDDAVFGLTVGEIILIYISIAFMQAILTYARSVAVMAVGMIKASRNLYKLLFLSVFRAKPVFFDVQPLGRILNRFTADIDIVDNNLPGILGQTSGTAELVMSSLIAIIIADKFVVLIILPCIVLYSLLVGKYRHFARDIQRMESISKSPVFNRIAETLGGLASVRAANYQNMFKMQMFSDIDMNQACTLLRERAQIWLTMRLEMLSVCISTASALLPLMPFAIADARASFVGVGLIHCLELSKFIQSLTQMLAQMEQKFTSPERIFEYCDLDSEAALAVPLDDSLPKGWPLKGAIEFREVTMRYRTELEPALCGLSFAVGAGEKLGIVGRTGSGKSSIIVTLLRMTERESGLISIDGQDLQQLGLQRLRTSLSMIPQEPVLFGNTTLRLNLDPFNEHSDAVVSDALAKVQMNKDDVLVNGLETKISEDGGGFSVGQRQLLCLARAVLRKSRVILLDEATASVDGETDALIQQTIREAFADSTVLCIAHRIRTILDSDRVLVMNQGVCQELGSPKELLYNSDSQLRALAIESGIEVPDLHIGKSGVADLEANPAQIWI